MDYLAKAIKDFHKLLQVDDPSTPTNELTDEKIAHRIRIMREELDELCEAMEKRHKLTDTAKEFADMAYVLWGTVATYGLLDDFERIVKEVHRSNMSKSFGADNAKAVKGPDYSPADLSFLDENQ